MQLFYEFIPVLLFFLAFKFYNIYVATIVGIVTTFLQVFITRIWLKKWDRKQLITLSVFVLFGGMTLYFHNPIFVKWKPTIVFWIFALVIFASQLFTAKPMMQRLMENVLEEKAIIPAYAWKRMNAMWAFFFLALGGLNLYIAYHFNNDTWVNFKFYGITGALLLFSVLQACYLMRHTTEVKK